MGRCLAVLVIAVSMLAQGEPLPAQVASPPTDAQDLPGVLVPRQLLEAKALVVGDVVRLSAEETGDGARPFRIVGVYEPTPDPLRITGRRLEARLHLPDLIDLTADPADRLAFARDLDARVPAVNSRRTVRPLGPSEPFVVIERFNLAISIVTLIGSTMFLLALMVVRVEERRETAGVLRVLGVPRRRVILNILAAGVLIALRLEVDVENVAMTRTDREGVGAGLDLYQLRACFHVAGRVGGRTIDFTAPGSAETFRGREGSGHPPRAWCRRFNLSVRARLAVDRATGVACPCPSRWAHSAQVA